MGYDETDYIPCEITACGKKAVDIHHIKARGMGGTKRNYSFRELMGLCRDHHEKYGDKKQYLAYLNDIHTNRMNEREAVIKSRLK